ncbi:MAG: sigma-70 family RNA polymerase sigma factor [Prolixibacteraceae bacterium]|nr:sigma-70 family RNA polymerase sigma factor [Prolixibacteraceae bacterium]
MEHLEIWEHIKKGDKNALKNLHTKYFYQMCLYARKTLNGNEGLAEELVSDCFIKIWENRKKIEIKSSLRFYLFFMLRNSIIDYHRKARIITGELIEEIKDPGGIEEFDEQQEYARLYSTLQKLPEQRRKILKMAVFDSLTYDQIAERLHISKNTVKTQIARAYRFLKESLDPKDFNLFLLIRSNKNSNSEQIR